MTRAVSTECGCVRSSGKEYTAQYTAGYNPQQNGIPEQKTCSLVEMVRCMLFDGLLEQRYWAELTTAVHLPNVRPTKPLDVTPYKIWTGVITSRFSAAVLGSISRK